MNLELRKAMLVLGLTAGALADLLGVSRSTIVRRLSGRSQWRRLEKERIEQVIICAQKNQEPVEQVSAP